MKIYAELDKFLDIKNVYSFGKKKRREIHTKIFNLLTKHHYENCKEYKNILIHLNYQNKKNYELSKLPFLPTTLFKNLNLISTYKNNIIKIMRSSGTTGKHVSKIYLDRQNSKNQIKALNNLFSDIAKSKKRMPMLIIDTEKIIKDRNYFSARTAAINGFSIFAKDVHFALNSDMTINYKKINQFYKNYKNTKNIIFGFTSIIWEKFCKNFLGKKKYNFSNSLLLHGGGWKKLEKLGITNSDFKKVLKKKFNIKKVINYYGMVEQTGSIFFECPECNNFVTSIFSDIFIRDENFNNLEFNKVGLVQLLSVLPTSYPGHNILTEDL